MKLRTDKAPYGIPMLLMALGVTLITFFSMIGWDSRVSMVYALTIAGVYAMALLPHYAKTKSVFILMCFVVVMIPVVLSAVRGGGRLWNVSYWNKALMFIVTILFFDLCSREAVPREQLRIIRLLLFVTAALIPFSFFVVGNDVVMGNYLAIHYVNSNFAGMWAVTSIFILVYLAFTTRRRLYSMLMGALVLVEVDLLFKTGTRSCMVALALFAIMILWGMVRRKWSISRNVLIGVLLSPILFSLVYMLLRPFLSGSGDLEMLTAEGKTLLSRSAIWTDAFQVIGHNPLMGDYYGISDDTGASQLHNIHVDILASYGLLAFVLFNVSVYNDTKFIIHNHSWPSYLAMAGFLCTFVYGWFEAAIVAGSMGLCYYAGFLLLLSKNEFDT